VYASIETPGPSVAVCHLQGSLDRDCSDHLRAVMLACAAFSEVQIDLAGVVFVDFEALGVLVGGVRRARERATRVTVFGASKVIARALKAAGFDRVIPLHEEGPTIVCQPALIAS